MKIKMTRYARARGSKASNERVPEEATPWHVMQQQLLNKCHKSQENKRMLTESTAEIKHATNEQDIDKNKLSIWTSFDSESKISQCEHKEKRKKMNNKKDIIKQEKSENIVKGTHTVYTDDKKEKKLNRVKSDQENHFKSKRSKLIKNIKGNMFSIDTLDRRGENGPNKTKHKKLNVFMSSMNENCRVNEMGHLKSKPNIEKNKRKFDVRNEKNKDHGRKLHGNDYTMYIHGKPVQVIRYDGVYIRKEDAEELNKLKLQLITKGVPRDEYLAILKLERRKAEKSLARERKKVCFKCRKSGHNLSECPEVVNDDQLGYCFKCGSTEHTHFECKVNRSEDYRFAHCFVCKEQGHISKQCPDNPRGLYPKGGACRLCGDVTHFKKDCPKNMEEKVKNTITIETLDNTLVEALDEELLSKPKTKKIQKNKIVNFK